MPTIVEKYNLSTSSLRLSGPVIGVELKENIGRLMGKISIACPYITFYQDNKPYNMLTVK